MGLLESLRLREPDRWEPIRTFFPYPDGWGVYNRRRHMVIETGLRTRAEAQLICDDENSRQRSAHN